MIDPKASSEEKLAQARRLFEESVDHNDISQSEMHRCSRFFHNSNFEGQWEEGDLQVLRDLGRPAFSFNVSRGKVETAIGMHKEQARAAVIRPVGSEDAFRASVLSTVSDCVKRKGGLDAATSESMRDGYIKGEGDVAIDVSQDPDAPDRIKISLFDVSPHEVNWDSSSRFRDRSDASHVAWDKWLSKTEFEQEYPDFKDTWPDIKGDSIDAGLDGQTIPQGEADFWEQNQRDYDRRSYYWDRNKNRARVIHMEYKTTVPRTFAVTEQGATLIEEAEAKIIRQDKLGRFADVQLQQTLGEEVHVLEFVGVQVLYDSTEDEQEPFPFEGFSIVPFVWAMDTEENVPYGMMRNLIDPQMEVNKAWSATLEQTVGQHKAGYIYEEDAIPDKKRFEEEVATSGSAAMVAKGAITGGQIQKRDLPQLSPAIESRLARGLDMLDRIPGITSDLERPAALNEPASRAALRYHKSNISLTDVREGFDFQLVELERRIMQTIMKAMSDKQIQATIGNDEKFIVQGGMVYEMGPHPQDPQQKVPVNQAPIRELRDMEYDIELDATTNNTTLRRIKVDSWTQLLQAGVPIPPVLIAESATDSRAEKEIIKKHAIEQGQQQQQAAAMQQKMQQQQLDQVLETETQKTAETSRHNQVSEILTAQKQASDAATKMASVLEKADDNETQMLLDAARFIEQQQLDRAAAQSAAQGGTQ